MYVRFAATYYPDSVLQRTAVLHRCDVKSVTKYNKMKKKIYIANKTACLSLLLQGIPYWLSLIHHGYKCLLSLCSCFFFLYKQWQERHKSLEQLSHHQCIFTGRHQISWGVSLTADMSVPPPQQWRQIECHLKPKWPFTGNRVGGPELTLAYVTKRLTVSDMLRNCSSALHGRPLLHCHNQPVSSLTLKT